MIDIHTHLLPQVDDGPESWDEVLEMIRRAKDDGIEGALCTSHVLNVLDDELESLFLERFDQLKIKLREANMDFQLWLAGEIHVQTQFDLNQRIATFNGDKKYLLIELPMGSMPPHAEDLFFNLSMEGVRLILAHPERNLRLIQKPSLAFDLVQRGLLLQVNAGSLSGVFGREARRMAFDLLDHQMVHFVASDCHGVFSRPMRLSPAYDIVKKGWGEERAKTLFKDNPHKAVYGEDIRTPEALPFESKSGFLTKILRGKK